MQIIGEVNLYPIHYSDKAYEVAYVAKTLCKIYLHLILAIVLHTDASDILLSHAPRRSEEDLLATYPDENQTEILKQVIILLTDLTQMNAHDRCIALHQNFLSGFITTCTICNLVAS